MTKKLLFVTTILLALSVAAFAADVSGKWTYEQPGRGGGNPTTVTLNLKAEGGALSGSITQNGRNGPTDTKISDGKVDGDNISFKVSRQMGDNTFTTEYVGKVSGDSISLKVTAPGRNGGEPTTREVTAKRATT
jgi:hypothetical protein